MQGERRMVTVLFCDVVGSTSMAERMDPEEWAEVMNEAFAHMIGPVNRYGGTVARLLGDALLAYFGAPVAHEDDPERALLSALAMMNDIGPFRERFRSDYGVDFDIRVGINTGRVVVGEVGAGGAEEYTVMGDAVNVAARMEQTAEPGTIRVGQATQVMVAPLFDFEDLGDVVVKGRTAPVRAFRALGRKKTPGRRRGLDGEPAPLVGRMSELGSLKLLLADLRTGRGGLVSLIAEAGLGKSRLLEETRAEWERGHPADADDAITSLSWQESRGVSYDSDRPYTMFIDRIRSFLGLDERDSAAETREKIAVGVRGIPDFEGDDLIDSLETLLAVKRDAADADAAKLRSGLFNGVEKVWRDRAASYPFVVVFEDLHWADSASVDLLLHLSRLVEELPILIICAFRPERRSQAWRFKQGVEVELPHLYAEIVLSPLSGPESGELVDSLLDVDGMPPQVRLSLVERAEGNPYFMEEAIRMLVDSKAIVTENGVARWQTGVSLDQLPLSGGALALVMARIDCLEEGARHTLQLASVIGRNFYEHVLKVVSDTADRIDRQLGDLQRAELILRAARVPEIEYMFKHELTREAAYGSILLRRRREFHRRVGEAIESLFPERLEEEATRLALHFGEAGDRERAFKYSVMAGDAAARIYANEEAITHYAKAVDMAQDSNPSVAELAHVYGSFGRTLEITNQNDRALALYRQLEAIGKHRGDEALMLKAMLPQATLHSIYTSVFDPDRGRELSERSLEIAGRISEPASEAKALWNLLVLEVFSGDSPAQAIEYGEASLEISRAEGLKEQAAYALHDLARAYLFAGRFKESEASREEAAMLWRELANLPMLADNLSTTATYHFAKGNLDQAEKISKEAYEVGLSSGGVWGPMAAFFGMASVQMERGHIDQAMSDVEQVATIAKDPDFAAGAFPGAMVAWIRMNAGDLDGALDAAENSVERSVDVGIRSTALMTLLGVQTARGELVEAENTLTSALEADATENRDLTNGGLEMARLSVGEFLLARGRFQDALDNAEERLSWLSERERLGFRPDHLRFKGLALVGLGRPEDALAPLEEASAMAEKIGSVRAGWRALAARAEVAAALGRRPEAASLRSQALEMVDGIVDGMADADRRRAFLALPEVRRLRTG